MLTIPFTSDPFHTFSTTLSGVEYLFDVAWNTRSEMWTFDLYDVATMDRLVCGVPIVIGCDILGPFGLGIGSMFAVDLTAAPVDALEADGVTVSPQTQHVDAGADDLGTRVIVVYLAPGEVLS